MRGRAVCACKWGALGVALIWVCKACLQMGRSLCWCVQGRGVCVLASGVWCVLTSRARCVLH